MVGSVILVFRIEANNCSRQFLQHTLPVLVSNLAAAPQYEKHHNDQARRHERAYRIFSSDHQPAQ